MDTPVLESAAIARKLAARGLLQPIPDLALSPSRGPPWQLPLDFNGEAKAGARDVGEVEPADVGEVEPAAA